MIIFQHPIWRHIKSYCHMPAGRDNVDLLDLPDDLRELCLDAKVNCAACGAVIYCFRQRQKSDRARIAGTPDERRLFYAATCPSSASPGCARTRAATEAKILMKKNLDA